MASPHALFTQRYSVLFLAALMDLL